MLSSLKNIIVNVLTVLAVVVGVLLVAIGYSDRIHPSVHPFLACLGMAFPAILVLNLAMLLVMLSLRWRRAWIPLAAFCIAYVPIRTFVPLHFGNSAAADDCDIRVMTYNVCGYGGNFKYEQGLDTVTAYIMAQNADIVCIQEEQCTKFKAQERWQQLYPYNDTVRVNIPSHSNVNAIGIHTRLPIVKKERIDYESTTNGSVAFYLLYGSDTIIVINNHLESTHLTEDDRTQYKEILKGNTERETAEEELHTLVEKLAEGMVKRTPGAEAVHRYVETHKNHPIIVCGDFNDTPISYTNHIMSQGLTDCFVESGCGLGLSYNRKGFNFRIDYILCTQEFTPLYSFIDSKMDASDHYPMICSMKIGNKP
jgi:exonuclease III